MGVVVVSLYGTDSSSALHYMHSQKAFFVAEAGIEYVIEKLHSDSSYRASPTTVTGDLSGGSFSVAVSKADTTYTLVSTATTNIATRVVDREVDVEPATGADAYPGGVPEAFEYAMHSFGNHTKFKDSNITVNGNVAATNQVQDSGDPTINGDITENSSVSAPFSVDMAGYRSIADTIESDGFLFTSGVTYGSPGNELVYYIEGNVTIPDNVTIYGSVIADNNIFIQSSGVTIDAASGYPALIADNNVHGNGLTNSTISGLIVADNNIDFDSLANTTINGTMLSDNNILTRSGDNYSVINYDPDIMINPPMYFPGYDPPILVTSGSWEEVY